MAEQNMSSPPCFLPVPGEPSISWKQWRNIFSTYLLAIAGDRYTPVRKQAILLHHLGAEGRRIYDDLPEIPLGTGDVHPTNVYEMSLLMLEKHLTPKLNTVFERHKFFSRVQGQDEDIMSFVATLRRLAVTCDFRDLSDSLIRDQIVRCTNNKKVKEKQLSMDPTLEENIQVARSMEHTATWMKEIEKSNTQIRDVDEKSTIGVKEVKN
ncbi:uncharacterized protein [Pleurodeles waltl]